MFLIFSHFDKLFLIFFLISSISLLNSLVSPISILLSNNNFTYLLYSIFFNFNDNSLIL